MNNEGKSFFWLYGENYSKTMNNNSFCMWKHVVNSKKNDSIFNYYVAEKNKGNEQLYRELNETEKKYFVWKNSKKHFEIYKKADMFIVTLSYKDVMPDKIFVKKLRLAIDRPVVYLQHGTLAMKKIDYTGKSYNNNMFKFLYYNKSIKQTLIEKNDFSDYQLYYAEFHPRYKELIRRKNKEKCQKQILWFMTWREYFGDNNKTKQLIENIKSVLSNETLKSYLKKESKCIKLCLHSFFDENQINSITKSLNMSNIEIVSSAKINVMDELVKSEMLITDYSSIGFDFTLLNKPVILYQPDFEEYIKGRELYSVIEELRKYSIHNEDDLANKIAKDENKINTFFREKLPDEIDYEYLEKGYHIDKIYEEFAYWQKHKVVFMGYDFDVENEINEKSKNIAIDYMRKNYMVEIQNIVSRLDNNKCPNGINYKAFYNLKYMSKIKKIKKMILDCLNSKKKLKNNKKKIGGYVIYLVEKNLKHDNSWKIISVDNDSRDFLNEYKKDFVVIEDEIC